MKESRGTERRGREEESKVEKRERRGEGEGEGRGGELSKLSTMALSTFNIS